MIEDYSIKTVVVGWVPVQCFSHRFKSVSALFRKAAETYGDKFFLAEGERRLTFKQTEDQVTRLAVRLAADFGIGRGTHVGLLMENSADFIVVFLGNQQLGATAVVFNHHLTAAELGRQIEMSDLDLLIYSPAFSAKVESLQPLEMKLLVLDSGTWPENEKSISSAEIDEDAVALILFTSGTTGLPKGTMITHRNLITSACKQGFYTAQRQPKNHDQNNKTILVAPLFHVLAIQEQLMGAIFSGTTLFILPVFNAEAYLDLIVREKINILTGTPTMFWLLLHKTPLQQYDLSCVETAMYGGAPMAPDLLTEMKTVFKEVQLINGYGLTEASVITLLQDEFCELHPISIGRPALCSEVRLVDAFDQEVKPNEVGELTVRGGLVTKGYYKLEEETRRAYKKGWFFTGDLGFQDEEGFIYLVGRSKEMINRGGEKVYPVEVENVLHLHPKILDVSVFGQTDPVMGETVCCAVVLRPGVKDFQAAEAQEFCQERLAYFKIPQKFFIMAELPRNPGGKVVKKKLVELTLAEEKNK